MIKEMEPSLNPLSKEKRLSQERKRKLKEEFEKKSQAFLDKAADHFNKPTLKKLDYGQIMDLAISFLYPDVKSRWYECDYEPLTKRKSHDKTHLFTRSDGKFDRKFIINNLNDLAEISALFYSFTKTRVHHQSESNLVQQLGKVDYAIPKTHEVVAATSILPLLKETKPMDVLVAGIGMDGIRDIDHWKERQGTLHLVDRNPFIAALLRHYIKINDVKNVVIHEEDVSTMKFKPKSLDHAKLDYCYKDLLVDNTQERFLDNITPALKPDALLHIYELRSSVDNKNLRKSLEDRGFKVLLKPTGPSYINFVAVKKS